MQKKNDYTKEIQGLKVTGRWLKWWFVLWVWHKVTGNAPGMPLYLLAALITVCLPIYDLVFAPFDRWLDRRLGEFREMYRKYRIKRSLRADRA